MKEGNGRYEMRVNAVLAEEKQKCVKPSNIDRVIQVPPLHITSMAMTSRYAMNPNPAHHRSAAGGRRRALVARR